MKFAFILLFLTLISCSEQNATNNQKEDSQIDQESFSYLSENESIELHSIDKRSTDKKTLLFKNESNQAKSVPFKILNKEDDGVNSNFRIAINRCLNVLPKQTCQVDIVFNSRQLTHLPNGAVYEARLSYNFNQATIVNIKGIATATQLNVKNIVLEGNTTIVENNGKFSTTEFYLKNNGTITTVLNVSVSSPFFKRIDRCSNISLSPGKKCVVQVSYNGRSGQLATGLINFDGQTIPVSIVSDVVDAPLGDFSKKELSFMMKDGIKEEILNFSNFSSVTIVPQNSGISFSDNKLIVDTSAISVNDYLFKIVVNKNGELREKEIELKIKPKFTLGNVSVQEGDFYDFNISIESSSIVESISTGSLESNFVIFAYSKNGITQSSLNRIKSFFNIGQQGETIIRLESMAKYESSGEIDFRVVSAGKSYDYSVPYVISRNVSNYPYVNFKYHSFRDGTSTNEQISALKSNLTGMRNSMSGWRIPILTDYSYSELYCNGERVNTFITTSTYSGKTIQDCLKEKGDSAGTDSINVYSFSKVFSESNQIGGIALGIQGGVVVGSDQYQVTAHEVGHVLGLFHTFETAFNYPLNSRTIVGLGSSRQIISEVGGVPYLIGYAGQPSNVTQVTLPATAQISGDWYSGIFTYGSTGAQVTNFDFSGITDDTDFDPYGVSRMSIYIGPTYSFFIQNTPFKNADIIYYYKGNQPETGIPSGYACSKGVYNFANKTYATSCEVGSLPLTNGAIKNQMSYWAKYEHGEFTLGQKQRMNKVLQAFPQYGVRP